MVCRVFAIFIWHCLCLLLLSSVIDANQADVECLRTFKSQVEDPDGFLSSWDFGNQTAQGFICKFSGVTCWHDDENRVLSISLPGYGLRGVFPLGITNCSDLTGLDLSRNNFSGPLPLNLTSVIPLVTTLDLSYNSFSREIPVSISNISYLTYLDLSRNNFSGPLPSLFSPLIRTLDLSYNSFSGDIPMLISNITFLNTLQLQHNQFTGTLPPQLAQLRRLKTFSVANNRLEGPIPKFNSASITSESFANNLNLCGKLLDDCKTSTKSRGNVVILAALCGCTVGAFVVGFVLGLFCSSIPVERLLFRKSR